MPDESHERLAKLATVELRLKNELTAARVEFDRANQEFRVASTHAQHLGLDTVDGAHALHQAAKQQTEAISAYSKAVGRFCDLILHGKLPED